MTVQQPISVSETYRTRYLTAVSLFAAIRGRGEVVDTYTECIHLIGYSYAKYYGLGPWASISFVIDVVDKRKQ